MYDIYELRVTPPPPPPPPIRTIREDVRFKTLPGHLNPGRLITLLLCLTCFVLGFILGV